MEWSKKLAFSINKKRFTQKYISKYLIETDFAITDLSHSRTIIEIEGQEAKEVLKKGCPFNFNSLKKDNCINSSV